eukprot:TRINITY_DN97_c0_g1_i3.p1 TRINITY_DN97_c0_g1~~TRINITY_DN97_c0_g1_i3.p1  ORF type:complete len:511 (+),score=112.14 TRINITY_DN97_c0_g1_i3:1030-2562(+)
MEVQNSTDGSITTVPPLTNTKGQKKSPPRRKLRSRKSKQKALKKLEQDDVDDDFEEDDTPAQVQFYPEVTLPGLNTYTFGKTEFANPKEAGEYLEGVVNQDRNLRLVQIRGDDLKSQSYVVRNKFAQPIEERRFSDYTGLVVHKGPFQSVAKHFMNACYNQENDVLRPQVNQLLAKNGIVTFSDSKKWTIEPYSTLEDKIVLVSQEDLEAIGDWPEATELDGEHDDVKKVIELIGKAIPNEEDQTSYFSSVKNMYTGNCEKKLLNLFLGDTDCLKSTLMKLPLNCIPTDQKVVEQSVHFGKAKETQGVKVTEMKGKRVLVVNEFSPHKIEPRRIKELCDEEQTYSVFASSNQVQAWTDCLDREKTLWCRVNILRFEPLVDQSVDDFENSKRKEATKAARFLESEKGKKAFRWYVSGFEATGIPRYTSDIEERVEEFLGKILKKKTLKNKQKYVTLTHISTHAPKLMDMDEHNFWKWIKENRPLMVKSNNRTRFQGYVCAQCEKEQEIEDS